jgi:Bacterial membrane protein YfhO
MDLQARGASDRRAALSGRPDPRRARALRSVALAALPFLLAVILLAPATLGGKVMSAGDIALFKPPFPPQPAGEQPENPLQFDSAYVFEPDGLAVREALRDGRLPVWSPELEAGWPLLATQQSAPLFPLTWIGAVFPYWESQAWIAVIKLWLAALGTFFFARALGLRRAPALLAAVSFAFGTYLVAWLMHPHANAYVVLPWLLLVAERLCRTGALRDAAALAGLLGVSFLSGQPESGLIVALATAAWVLYRLLSERPPRREALRTGTLAAAAALLGAAIGALMVVPLVEALNQSFLTSRSQPPLPAKVGISLAFPEYWGPPDRPVTGAPSNFTERTLYVGALPALLALGGLFAARPRGPQLFFAGLALASLAVALDTGPVSSLAGDLPVLDQVALHRVLVLASFAIAMLAAFGLQSLLDGTGRRRVVMAVAAGAALPAVAVLVAHPSWTGDVPDGLRRLFGGDDAVSDEVVTVAATMRWVLLAAVAVALVAALARRPRHARALAGAAVAFAALDLIALGFGYNPAIPKAEADPPAPPAVEAMRRLTAAGGRVVGVDGLIPNTASRWGLHDARGHEQPLVERTARVWLQFGTTGDGAVAVDPDRPETVRLLDVFGVRAALLDPSTLRAGRVAARAFRRDPIAYSGPGGVVVERPSAFPPAFVAYGWRASAGLDESLLHMTLSTSEQLRDIPVIEGAGDAPASARPATPARVLSRSDTEVRLDVRASARGQLVLLDTFYPGWHAEVDGREAPIRPADAAFRAVPVERGRHEVRFFYRPASVIWGGAVTLLGLAAMAAALVLGGRRPTT